MKPLFATILLVIFIQACSDNQPKVEAATQKDSLIVTPKVDSFVLNEQEKAIGEIKFGISEKQFDKEKEKFDKKTEVPAWEGSTAKTHKIGEYEYYWLDGFFHNDSLYKVVVKGKGISYEDYNTDMREQYNSLSYMLRTKFNEPNSDNGLPSWTSIEKNDYKICASWKIGDRTIDLKVYSQGTRYYLDLVSYKHDIDLDIFLMENRKKIEAREKGAKAL